MHPPSAEQLQFEINLVHISRGPSLVLVVMEARPLKGRRLTPFYILAKSVRWMAGEGRVAKEHDGRVEERKPGLIRD